MKTNLLFLFSFIVFAIIGVYFAHILSGDISFWPLRTGPLGSSVERVHLIKMIIAASCTISALLSLISFLSIDLIKKDGMKW